MQDNRNIASDVRKGGPNGGGGSGGGGSKIDPLSASLVLVIIIISIVTMPQKALNGAVTLKHVWYYGWITAISTGLGTRPFK